MKSGTMLAHYRVAELIGKGGMGEVYRAQDTKLDRDVALKILPAEFAADRDRMARFDREAKLLASLHHPNIASIFGFESTDECTFLVMELVEGEDLSETLRAGPLPRRRSGGRRAPDRRGARRGAREGHRPPRSEARQRQAHSRRQGEGAGLRPGAGLRRPDRGRRSGCQRTRP